MSHFQLQRILEIDSRIRAKKYPNAESLAAELEVSPRVIFKDRKFLLEILNAPLEFDRTRRGWYYSEPNWVLPATQISEGDLLAFLLSVEVAQRNLGGALGDAFRSAVNRLAQTLPSQVEVQMNLLASYYSFAEPAHTPTQAVILAALHEAITQQKVTEITYYTASTGQRKSRCVHPHHLYHAHGDWYLAAFDVDRGAMRNFHVGRIESHTVSEKAFARAPDFDGARWIRASFVTETDGPAREIVIRFDEYQARYVRERRFHETQSLEERPDGGVILRFQSSGLAEVRRWVMAYGAHAEVLAPAELRRAVMEEVGRMSGIYGGDK